MRTVLLPVRPAAKLAWFLGASEWHPSLTSTWADSSFFKSVVSICSVDKESSHLFSKSAKQVGKRTIVSVRTSPTKRIYLFHAPVSSLPKIEVYGIIKSDALFTTFKRIKIKNKNKERAQQSAPRNPSIHSFTLTTSGKRTKDESDRFHILRRRWFMEFMWSILQEINW